MQDINTTQHNTTLIQFKKGTYVPIGNLVVVIPRLGNAIAIGALKTPYVVIFESLVRISTAVNPLAVDTV